MVTYGDFGGIRITGGSRAIQWILSCSILAARGPCWKQSMGVAPRMEKSVDILVVENGG